MNLIVIDKNSFDVKEVVNLINKDKVIVFPTDTCYGIIAKYSKENARKINMIKQRDLNMHIPLLFYNVKDLDFLNKDQKNLLNIWMKKHKNSNTRISYIINENLPAMRRVCEKEFAISKILKKTYPLLASSFNRHCESIIENLCDFKEFNDNIVYKLYFFKDYKNSSPSKIFNIFLGKYIR